LSDFTFSVSTTGNVAYWSGYVLSKTQLTWFERTGRPLDAVGEPGYQTGMMLSPDGKSAAIETPNFTAGTADIWLQDLVGGKPSRLTYADYFAQDPLWTPDSQRVLFVLGDQILVQPVHGGAPEEIPFPRGLNGDYPLSVSPDGRYILFQRNTQETSADLWILPLFGDRKPRKYLNTAVAEFAGRISPDGHWVAYAANESDHNEVFVQSFPVPGNKIRISLKGGQMPIWRKDGRELYFLADDNAIMAVGITTDSSSLHASAPVRLLQVPVGKLFFPLFDRLVYAPSPDGQRFLVLVPLANSRPQGIHIIHNWRPTNTDLAASHK
jgi:Tol biopolymer transport system component